MTPNARIVGGVEAVPYSIPSQILLFQTYQDTGMSGMSEGLCGGTLIRPNVVITAAHCISTTFPNGYGGYVNYRPNQYYPTFESTFDVYAGVHDKTFFDTEWNPPYPGVRRQVKKIIVVNFI